MVDWGDYELKPLNTGNITPEESFMNAYAEEIHESEQVHTYTKWLHVHLDTKYENADLNKVTKKKCQQMIEEQCNELINLLQNTKSCLMQHSAPGKRSSRLWIKIGCRAYMFETISSTKVTWRNV